MRRPRATRVLLLAGAAALLCACQVLSGLNELRDSAATGNSRASSAAGGGAGSCDGGVETSGGGDGGCGACGPACIGAMCVDGMCKPISVQLPGDHPAQPRLLAVHASYVYWGNTGDIGQQNGGIWRAPMMGGDLDELAGGIEPSVLVTDGVNVYWDDGTHQGQFYRTGVMSVAATGGTPMLLYPEPLGPAQGIAVRDAELYWTVPQSGVLSAGSTRGSARRELAMQDGAPVDLALDGTYVYFHGSRGVERVPMSGGSPPQLLVDTGNSFGDGIAVDDAPTGYVYWTVASAGEVRRAPKDGSSRSSELVDNGLDGPSIILVDDNYIYWAEGAVNCVAGSHKGAIKRRSKSGAGSTETLEDNLDCPSLTMDRDRLYWTNGSGFTIYPK